MQWVTLALRIVSAILSALSFSKASSKTDSTASKTDDSGK